jgi:alpha-L-fucosidase
MKVSFLRPWNLLLHGSFPCSAFVNSSSLLSEEKHPVPAVQNTEIKVQHDACIGGWRDMQNGLFSFAHFFAVTALVVGAVAAQAQTTPTAAQDPVVIDHIWQQASSKYDGQRNSILADVDRISHSGPFRPDFQSLQSYEVPDWYKDAKFGIFIHWGVYSVPAYGSEWYPRLMYIQGSDEYKHHIATYGTQDKFGYKDFIPQFKAAKFDPAAWAHLFKMSGARYVVPVFEHHDGFAMYDSGLSDWTAVKMGPKRDLVGDLSNAVRAEGLHLGASSHRVEHNFFFGEGRTFKSDVNDPANAALYGPAHVSLENAKGTPLSNDFTYVSDAWANDWLARSAEIVEKYHPDIMYFDWWIGQPRIRESLTKFAAFYYNASLKDHGYVGVLNYKDYSMQSHSAVLDLERGQLSDIRPLYWQTDTSISNKSWGYIEHDTFKTPEFVVHQLVDIVSKNGNLLMNIGPRSDGTIPTEVQQVLLSVGDWLKTNGEAIYGTRAWFSFGEGPTQVEGGSFHDTDTQSYTPEDFRFTTKAGTLYAIEMAWPANGKAIIHTLTTDRVKVVSVVLLATGEAIPFEQKTDGLHLQLPTDPHEKYAYAYKITLQ